MELPKILICAPQHESKNYAFDKWYEAIQNLTYPKDKISVFLADNSETDENVKHLKSLGIKAVHIPQNQNGVIATISDSHNACREYAIKKGFEFMLHLETDVIVPVDVIERLLISGKKICAGTYDLFYGSKRTPMIQIDEPYDQNIIKFRNPAMLTDEEPLFFNGKIQKVYHAGLGCILIHRSIFQHVPFRYVKGANAHPDTWFANDLYQIQIPIFVDTTIQCDHLNSTWLGKMD